MLPESKTTACSFLRTTNPLHFLLIAFSNSKNSPKVDDLSRQNTQIPLLLTFDPPGAFLSCIRNSISTSLNIIATIHSLTYQRTCKICQCRRQVIHMRYCQLSI